MSYTLTPFAVNLANITAVLGSKDESLVVLLTKKCQDEFDNIDALGDDYAEPNEVENKRSDMSLEHALSIMKDFLLSLKGVSHDDEDKKEGKGSDTVESRPPCAMMAEALRHLVMAEQFDRRVGFKYGYVLECLCEHFGERLPNDYWCDLRSCHNVFRDLDSTLVSAGVPATTLSIQRHLVERGAPISIPKYNDFPYIGYLTFAEIEPALNALCAVKIDDSGEENDEDEEHWLPEGLDDVRRWLGTCAESKRDLVCFYY